MSKPMKSWHITVLEGYKKVIVEKISFSVKEAKEIEKELKEQYKEPDYKVLRELF